MNENSKKMHPHCKSKLLPNSIKISDEKEEEEAQVKTWTHYSYWTLSEKNKERKTRQKTKVQVKLRRSSDKYLISNERKLKEDASPLQKQTPIELYQN